MEGVNNFDDYKTLFNNELVVVVRGLLQRIEDMGGYDIEDSSEHNALIEYFNKFALHKEIDEEQFKIWK